MSHFWTSDFPFDAVFFDFGNVLVPFHGVGQAAFAHALTQQGVDDPVVWLPQFTAAWTRGDPTLPVPSVFAAAVGYEALQPTLDCFWKEYTRRTLTAPELPGASALLRDLKGAEIRMALIAQVPETLIERQLKVRGWATAFDVRLTREKFDQPKPDPSSYRRASAELGSPLERSLALEHSSVGVSAAKSAGLSVVHVGCRNEATCSEPADFHAYDLNDVASDVLGMTPV